jgi:hypothetical protein
MSSWPPLWSSGQSYWLQIRRPGFDSRQYQIFWEKKKKKKKKRETVVGLERSPLSLVSTIEKLLERKSSGSGLESREYGSRDLSRWPRGTLYPQKFALNSPTSGGRSVGIVHSWTQDTEFNFYCFSIKSFLYVTHIPIVTIADFFFIYSPHFCQHGVRCPCIVELFLQDTG